MRILSGIIALAVVIIVTVQLAGNFDDPPVPLNDPAIRNLITLFSVLAIVCSLWIWFCFASRYSRKLRWSVALGSVAMILLLVGTVATLRKRRLLSFSGSLIPRLASVERTPSELSSPPASRRADFRLTSEFDFPQFLGPQRTGWVRSPELARDWESNPPRLIWQRTIGPGWSSFAANQNYAVTMEQRGEEECVVCYELATGNSVWSHAIVGRHDTALGGVGPRATPTIYNGYVYALGATGVLRCLNESGELVWSDDLRKRYGVTSQEDEANVMFGRSASPLIVDACVVVAGGGPQGRAKNLVAFDCLTGELKWESECKLPTGEADQIAYASPTLATLAGQRQILIVNESTASGHNAQTGELLWSHSWPGRSNGAASVSQAVPIENNRVLLTKGYSGGAELIELSASAGSEGESLSVKSIWKVARVLQTKFSNVVVHHGHAYGLSEGILECVDIATGRRRWKNGRYGHGQVLGVNELLFILSEDGELHLLEMNPEKATHLSSIPMLPGKSWNNLCLVNKRLLARNAEHAVCYELP